MLMLRKGSPSENEIDEKINTGLIQDDILDFIDNEFERKLRGKKILKM